MLKHYVRFIFPGAYFNEFETQEVAERNPALITVPEKAFAYCFFDVTVVKVGKETLVGEANNFSPLTYFGEAYTLEEVKAQFPECTALIYNMEHGGLDRVVRTRSGNWQPLGDEDQVI